MVVSIPRSAYNLIGPRGDATRDVEGYYHRNTLRERAGARLVERTPIAGGAQMDLRRIPERATLRFLADVGFPAPRIVEERGATLVLRYIEGALVDARWPRSARVPDWIPGIAARALRALHALEAAPLAPYCADIAEDFFGALLSFARELHARRARELGPVWERLGAPVEPFARVAPPPSSAGGALLHADAHRKNLVIPPGTESLVLLDWELAVVGDPAYDLAVHLHRMRYPPEQEAAFLRAYGASRAALRPYAELEAVRSAIGDLARYVPQMRALDAAAQRELAAHYAGKLARAWRVWRPGERAPDVEETLRAMRYEGQGVVGKG